MALRETRYPTKQLGSGAMTWVQTMEIHGPLNAAIVFGRRLHDHRKSGRRANATQSVSSPSLF